MSNLNLEVPTATINSSEATKESIEIDKERKKTPVLRTSKGSLSHLNQNTSQLETEEKVFDQAAQKNPSTEIPLNQTGKDNSSNVERRKSIRLLPFNLEANKKSKEVSEVKKQKHRQPKKESEKEKQSVLPKIIVPPKERTKTPQRNAMPRSHSWITVTNEESRGRYSNYPHYKLIATPQTEKTYDEMVVLLREEVKKLREEMHKESIGASATFNQKQKLRKVPKNKNVLEEEFDELKSNRLKFERDKNWLRALIGRAKTDLNFVKFSHNSPVDPLNDINGFPYLSKNTFAITRRKRLPLGPTPRMNDFFEMNPPSYLAQSIYDGLTFPSEPDMSQKQIRQPLVDSRLKKSMLRKQGLHRLLDEVANSPVGKAIGKPRLRALRALPNKQEVTSEIPVNKDMSILSNNKSNLNGQQYQFGSIQRSKAPYPSEKRASTNCVIWSGTQTLSSKQ